MKIGFLGPASMVHTVRWVNALAEEGHEVVLYSLPSHKAGINKIDPRVHIKYLRYTNVKGYFFNFLLLRSHLRVDKPEILNVHYASGYGTLGRLANYTPCLLNLWGSDIYSFPRKDFLRRWLLMKNLNHADVLASTSNVMKNEARKYIKDDKPVFVTPFGVDIERFRPSVRVVDKKKLVVGNVKALEKAYGIDNFIHAAAIVLKEKSFSSKLKEVQFEFQIFGGGELEYELKALAKSLGVEKQVKFMGVIPNSKVPQALSNMDIFCATSENESFGVAVVEAMACGLPVVATDIDGFREVIGDSNAGILVEPKSPISVANAIIELALNPDTRLALSSRARQRIESLYSWKKNVLEMTDLYKNIISKSPGAGFKDSGLKRVC